MQWTIFNKILLSQRTVTIVGMKKFSNSFIPYTMKIGDEIDFNEFNIITRIE